jgi:hypothetical protein
MIAPMPSSMMMIAITQAKIGRSMKTRHALARRRWALPPAGAGSLRAAPGRLDRRAVLRLRGLGDDLFAGARPWVTTQYCPASGRDDDALTRGCRARRPQVALPLGSRVIACCGPEGVCRSPGRSGASRTSREQDRLRIGEARAKRDVPVAWSTSTSAELDVPVKP